ITTAKNKDAAPIELLLRDGERYHTVSVTYHGGLRYPHLEGNTQLLDTMLAPLGAQKDAAGSAAGK
uniref:hypothetical protein n=1 Tax=Acetobacter malorum TaxID=178901 RepID=UPI00248EADB8